MRHRAPASGQPGLTLLEAAKIGHTSGVGADWPVQYLSGKNQLERNLERERQMAAQVTAGLSPQEQANLAQGVRMAAVIPAVADVESRVLEDHHQALKIWLRLLACTTRVENVIRQRLRSEFAPRCRVT